MFSDDDEQHGNFEGFCMSSEKKMMSGLLTCVKDTHLEFISKFEEVDIEEVFNTDNETPIVHSLTSGEIAKVVLDQGNRDNDDEDDDVNTAEKMPIDNMVKIFNT